MALLQDLPNEIIVGITRYLPQSALPPLACVSSKFQAPAEDALYLSPVVELHYFTPVPRCNTVYYLRQFAITLLL